MVGDHGVVVAEPDVAGPGCRCCRAGAVANQLDFVRLSADGRGFQFAQSGEPFVLWGVNYDHDDQGRLIEDYWLTKWPTVQQHFADIKALGGNCVRIHLQLGRFLASPTQPQAANLQRLADLVRLAEQTGLYLNLTGLGCYHKADVPDWYDQLSESQRWEAQANFWQFVAEAATGSPALFCYDLMNEPIVPGAGKVETEWLAGQFAGKHFVQRIVLELGERPREQVAQEWILRLVTAIRGRDPRTLITVGAIPWSMVWPNARPVFYSPQAAQQLDFVSIHVYPRRGQVEQALQALKAYDIGKPIVIEEMFPLHCDIQELDAFVEGSRAVASGWMGFYWGVSAAEYRQRPELAAAITAQWLDYFSSKSPAVLTQAPP